MLCQRIQFSVKLLRSLSSNLQIASIHSEILENKTLNPNIRYRTIFTDSFLKLGVYQREGEKVRLGIVHK